MLKDVECAGSRLLNTMDINVKGLYAALLDSMGRTGREYREEMARYGTDLTGLVPREIVDDVNRRMREIERKED